MYLLPALAAGLVRCIHIDRLHKLSEGIGSQLREDAVPLYPLNKLLYILCLLFLFMDLQIMHIFVNSTVSVLAIMLKLLHQKSKTDLPHSPPRTLLSPFDTWLLRGYGHAR